METRWTATDLFSGCGGLTAGLKRAGFKVVSGVEIEQLFAETYERNHPEVKLLTYDITEIDPEELRPPEGGSIDLVAGCPPCQGFSRVRRQNRAEPADDDRNNLIVRFQHIVERLTPVAVFMENVPGIERDERFLGFLDRMQKLGYNVNWSTLELSEYGVPQRRSRVVVLAGRGFYIAMPRARRRQRTVWETIGDLPLPSASRNPLHHQVTQHDERALERIRAVPKNGGSRRSWPQELWLKCHRKCDGFKDVYGRMAWDEPAPTITGGCINASKGRFIHPEQDRAITLFEAALLQTFSRHYRFSLDQGRWAAAEMIGNALPPRFAEIIGSCIARALKRNCHG